MKTLDIYGDNRFKTYTKIRESCRGIVIRDNEILLSYETNTDTYNIPGGGLEHNESFEECCSREVAVLLATIISVNVLVQLRENFRQEKSKLVWNHGGCHYKML